MQRQYHARIRNVERRSLGIVCLEEDTPVVVDLQIVDQGWHVCMGRHRTCGLPRYVRFLKDAFGPKSRPFPLSDIILIRAICSPTSS